MATCVVKTSSEGRWDTSLLNLVVTRFLDQYFLDIPFLVQGLHKLVYLINPTHI